MVKLSDLDDVGVRHLIDKDCPPFEARPWVTGPPVAQRRVAIVTTAGLHRRDDRNFALRDLGYRVIPGDIDAADLVMTQSSVNYDRTGFQQDVNVVFPIDRLRELVAAREVGELADFHYSLNGAGWHPHEIEPTARELAGLLKEDQVNGVLLVPV
ncbi:MAG: glycine/sarcosine/betaine reductase selenoprotein B family protein [Alphaproteobacteria bacterium]|nr:glycine/sarcosine/betaine reductase selenoprotein B family protein [Alphaproteobacteria bacterium]